MAADQQPSSPAARPLAPPPDAAVPHARRRAPAAETVRLYAADRAAFESWCRAHQKAALPASPDTLTAYLAHAAERLSAGALGRRVAAVADHHRRHGLPSPASDPAVRAVLRQARAASARRRPLPLPAEQLRAMARACPADLAGQRDRVLLLLAASGLGRGALVGLDAEHVQFTAGGLELRVRMPRGSVAPIGVVSIARQSASGYSATADAPACAVRELEAWVRVSDCRFGPVFRKVDRWGNIEHRRLCTDALRRILQRRDVPGGACAT